MDDKFFIPNPPSNYERKLENGQHIPRLTDGSARPHRASASAKISMRRMAGFAVAALVVIAAIAGGISLLADRQKAAREAELGGVCEREAITLEIAKSAGPVMSMERKGTDIVVTVSWRAWTKTVRATQVDIAMSA